MLYVYVALQFGLVEPFYVCIALFTGIHSVDRQITNPKQNGQMTKQTTAKRSMFSTHKV